MRLPSDLAEVVARSVDARSAVGGARSVVGSDQTGTAFDASGFTHYGRVEHHRVGWTASALRLTAARLLREVARRTRNAAGSVRSLSAGQANAGPAFHRTGDVDAVKPGHVRVEDAHPLGSAPDVVLRPRLFLESPVERVRSVLRHAVRKVLTRGAAAPRFDDRNASGRRALHEHELTVGLAVQLEGERDAGASAEPFLDLQR